MKVICNRTRLQTAYLSWLVIINIIILTAGWVHQGWLGFGSSILINMGINLLILKSYRNKLKKNCNHISINMGAFKHTKPKSYYEIPLVDIEQFFVKPYPKKKRTQRIIHVVFNRNQSYDFVIDRSQLLKLETVVRRPLNYSLMPKKTTHGLPKQRRFIWFQVLGSLIGVGLTAIGILLYNHANNPTLNGIMVGLIVIYALIHFSSFLDQADPWHVKLSQSIIGMVIYVLIVFSVITVFSNFILENPFSMVYMMYAIYALSSFVVVVLILITSLYIFSYA